MATVRATRLIFCGGRNARAYEVARECGFLPGSQLPSKVPDVAMPLHFADQDWKAPDRASYVAAVARYRPEVATVLDWEEEGQEEEVMAWAEEVAPFVETLVVIPKVPGTVGRVPGSIGGRPVVLGYSVPTSFGGTTVPLWEFRGRPVHLLGGSPHRQLGLRDYLRVVSADGNMALKMANSRGCYWSRDRGPKGRWTHLGKGLPRGSNYECLRRSLEAVANAWITWGQ